MKPFNNEFLKYRIALCLLVVALIAVSFGYSRERHRIRRVTWKFSKLQAIAGEKENYIRYLESRLANCTLETPDEWQERARQTIDSATVIETTGMPRLAPDTRHGYPVSQPPLKQGE